MEGDQMRRRKVVIVVGTRPEVIKMSPLIRELKRREELFDHVLVTTAQHREMLDQALGVFGLEPDIDLGLMQQNQGLVEFASRSLTALSEVLANLQPDVLLIQGDTTTVMTAALAAFYQGVRVGHVEAGLRSFDRMNPFPEELNRRIASCLATLHFAPTERARLNLLGEGVPPEKVFVTGNTIVDALQSVELAGNFDDPRLASIDFSGRRVLFVTAHRRESYGEPLRSICRALKTLTMTFDNIEIVYPVHMNPSVGTIVRRELKDAERIHLIDPVSYRDLLRLIQRCLFVMTDSGGIQEEAPSFHKPVLVMRDVTERPELVESNAGLVVGTATRRIVDAASRLLSDSAEYARMSEAPNPFGDGRAAERIASILAEEV